ncbi:RagB/SusD family nutrient uptake outer membrane protein [Sinomicrobium sp.]
MKNRIISICLTCFTVISLLSCGNDFLEESYDQNKTPDEVGSDKDLQALVYGAMHRMRSEFYYGRDFVIFGTVRSDIAFNTGATGRFLRPARFDMIPTEAYAADTWTQMYTVIGSANLVIGSELDTPLAKFAKAQAYTLRALVYFDLVRLYGQEYIGGDLGVPLVTVYEPGNDVKPQRASLDDTYAQIESDFEMAIQLFTEADDEGATVDYNDKTTLNIFSAEALMARYYLSRKDYEKARDFATDVIESGLYSVVSSGTYAVSWTLPNASSNSVLELAVGDVNTLSTNSIAYIYSPGGYGEVFPVETLSGEYDSDDVRLDVFAANADGEYLLGKYPDINGADNIRMVRIEEMYLTRAEAEFMLNGASTDVDDDLNAITAERNSVVYAGATLEDILLERKKELAFEGFRYFDLMRLGMDVEKVDENQTFESTIPFGDDRLAFPIPQVEINANPDITPNP